MARFRDPSRPNHLTDGFADIPYLDIAGLLFNRGEQQRLVPFLGAGASLPHRPAPLEKPVPVDQTLLQTLVDALKIETETARFFLEIAVAIAARLRDEPPPGPGGAYEAVRTSRQAPSAAELAQALAEKSSYDYFAPAKRRVFDLTGREDWDEGKLTRLLASLARLTAIGSPVPPLLDASSYAADRKKRAYLWADLHRLFENKDEPTSTHTLIAHAASAYLKGNHAVTTAEDFLVITTNYDRLLEIALDSARLPYYVLTVPRGQPPKVDLRFSTNLWEYLGMEQERFDKVVEYATTERQVVKTTSQFTGLLNKTRPLIVVYKIHGSLHLKATADKDGIVITNEDYVTSFNATAIPSYVRDRLGGLGLLLLGYSFSDWNIRSLYASVTARRGDRDNGTMDYAVLRNPSPYETGFFERNGIDILDTTLDSFCERMLEAAG